MRHFVRLALVALTFHASQVPAQQEAAFAERGPQFLLAANGSPERIEATRMPLLRQRISLDLRDVSMHEAITAISKQSGLRLMFGDNILPRERTVTLRAEAITVAAALTEVLLDAGVDVLFSRSGNAALVRRSALGAGLVGTIAGRVTDATTQQGIEGVRVSLEGTRASTTTASDGSYRLTGVAAGAYMLVTRRLGYRASERAVTVQDGREVAVDVALQPVPSALDEVVVTVTGDQRLRELGHVVGRINADSVVREAPVSNLSELLTARVPGLQVFQDQGTVGGRVNVRIRGPSSIGLSNQPIVVIDGVRYSTSQRLQPIRNLNASDTEPASPLNDLNINDIESVEVAKGPSAATLYGTDAANGVIVITTKRGRPGPARWNAYARTTLSEIPTNRVPELYWGWGTVNGTPNNPTTSCTLARLASGACTQQDSISVLPNPLNDPEYTIYGSKPGWEYGVNVGGGERDLRYYFSADLADAKGPVSMPRALVDQLKQERGLSELPEEWLEPNAFRKLNLRSNLSVTLGKKAELTLNAAYVENDNRAVARSGMAGIYGEVFRATPATLSTPYRPDNSDSPGYSFAKTTADRTERFVGSMNGRWQPLTWLATRATLGLDLTSGHQSGLIRPGDQPIDFFNRDGAVDDSRVNQRTTTADLGATATLRRGVFTARTAVGAEYVRGLSSALASYGVGLGPGASVVQAALTVVTRQQHSESVVYGGYVEEMLGLNERLFLSGAIRVDGASTFGRDYSVAVYPKVGASWLISEEPLMSRVRGLGELRLRYAFGISGKQPNTAFGGALPTFVPGQIDLNGQRVQTVSLQSPGNPDIGPERVREHEIGFDLNAFANRIGLEVTGYRRRTNDMLVGESGPPGRGFMFVNLGLVTQRGFEAQVRGRILDLSAITWDVALLHSEFDSKLVDLGAANPMIFIEGGWKEGYPLGARFEDGESRIIGGTDLNGNGILESGELQFGDSAVYLGESLPPKSQTLTSTAGLMQGRLRLSAVLDRKTGFTQIDAFNCARSTCREAVDISTPIEQQLRVHRRVAQNVEKGDFTRLREVSVALDLPTRLASRMRLSRATIVGSARNLALWTAFSGLDPEGGISPQETGVPSVAGGFIQGNVPQSRTFSIRLDVGF